MSQHAPGVVCIVSGVTQNSWAAKDNGRLVVIVRLSHISPRGANVWVIKPFRKEDGPLHVMRMTKIAGWQPVLTSRVRAAQKYLIPIRPEGEFNEQVIGTEVDHGELDLCQG